MSMNLKEDKKAYAIMGCAMRVHRILGTTQRKGDRKAVESGTVVERSLPTIGVEFPA